MQRISHNGHDKYVNLYHDNYCNQASLHPSLYIDGQAGVQDRDKSFQSPKFHPPAKGCPRATTYQQTAIFSTHAVSAC